MIENNDGILPGETDYRHLETKILGEVDGATRLRLAANMLAQCFETAVLMEIVRKGFSHFLTIAKPVWASHNFTRAEYSHAFEIVKRALADRNAQARRLERSTRR